MVRMRCVFFAALALTAVIALYPNLQLPEPSVTRGFTDKIYHVVGFVVLIILAGNAWQFSVHFVLYMISLAFILELSQFLSEGRGVFLVDLIANLVGVAIGLLLLQMTIALQRRSDFRDRLSPERDAKISKNDS